MLAEAYYARINRKGGEKPVIRSMTGYGRAQKILSGRDILVEIRSVNHRYYEYSSRIPRTYNYIDEKLKALLKQFEVQDIATAISLTECLDDYVLTPEISSPQETAIDQLHFMTDDHSVELLISHVNLYAYGCDLIREDNAVLSPYGLLHRADYQPMLSPMQETQKMEMTMK